MKGVHEFQINLDNREGTHNNLDNHEGSTGTPNKLK